MKKEKNKIKMYLAVALVMLIIITAWIINLKNSFNKNNEADLQNQKLKQIVGDFNKIFINTKNIKDQMVKTLNQSPTTTSAFLQGRPKISPNQLYKIMDKLNTNNSSTSTTSTSSEL